MVFETSIKSRTNDEMVVFLALFNQSRDASIIVSSPQVHQAIKL
jgi:hypothetical protein